MELLTELLKDAKPDSIRKQLRGWNGRMAQVDIFIGEDIHTVYGKMLVHLKKLMIGGTGARITIPVRCVNWVAWPDDQWPDLHIAAICESGDVVDQVQLNATSYITGRI